MGGHTQLSCGSEDLLDLAPACSSMWTVNWATNMLAFQPWPQFLQQRSVAWRLELDKRLT